MMLKIRDGLYINSDAITSIVHVDEGNQDYVIINMVGESCYTVQGKQADSLLEYMEKIAYFL